MVLTTILAHESGEWIVQDMSLPVSKPDAQGAGSAITYMRRYALAAVIGVVQADDDGNEATKERIQSITPQQINMVTELLQKTNTDTEKFLAYFKKQSVMLLDKMQATNAISILEKKLKELENVGE